MKLSINVGHASTIMLSDNNEPILDLKIEKFSYDIDVAKLVIEIPKLVEMILSTVAQAQHAEAHEAKAKAPDLNA